MMLEITSQAASQIRHLVAEAGGAPRGLRIFIEKGGCSGRQYSMKIDQVAPEDTVVESEEAKIFVDPESLALIRDSVIDYEDSLTSTGFRIRNPNAKQTCGCGTSFEA